MRRTFLVLLLIWSAAWTSGCVGGTTVAQAAPADTANVSAARSVSATAVANTDVAQLRSILQTESQNMNGYSGGFAYNPATGVTLVVAATKNATPAIDPAAIHILRQIIQYVTPSTPLTF